MKATLTVLSLLISLNSFCQNELKKIKLSDQYSWRTHTLEELNKYYFNLNPIKESTSNFHFRYQQTGQIIDIKSENGKDFKGEIINHIYEYKDVKTEYGEDVEINNYIFEVIDLDTLISNKLGKYLLANNYHNIPTDSLIENWNFLILHCSSIHFNYKLRDSIFSNSFFCYWGQADSIEYHERIDSLDRKIRKNLKLEESYNNFAEKLTPGIYSSDGYRLLYILTEKQTKRWKQSNPKRDYLNSISDTITNYIEYQLNQLISKEEISDCYDDFEIFFSKKGKLKKIKTNLSWKEKLSDKDYRRCKRFLKSKLKKIKIDFINPKYKFQRNVDFNSGEIYVYDNTSY